MPILLGAFLGFCNVLFIAMGLQWRDPSLPAHYVITFGLVPGVIVGAFVGHVAGATASWSAWLRRVLLAITPLGLVGSLAGVFELGEHTLVAAIPTLVSVMLLERWSRVAPALPTAILERS